MKQPTPLWGLVALVLLGLTWTTPGWAEQRTALVIGNSAYGELGVLRNPVNDATDIATALRRLSFDVTLLRDADLRTMQEAVETFVRQLRQGGVGLFYYAGHGMQVHGENYLIPLRARINREQDVAYEAVPVGRILGGMEDAGNQLNLIILDACRDNPYARQWRSAQRGLAVVQAARGSLIAYATAPGTVASDGSGRNGLYTEHLLKHLATPALSVEHLFKQVRIGVVETTKGKQTPWESSSLVGDFFFVPSAPAPAPGASSPVLPASPAPLSSTPAGPDAEAAMWALVEKSSRPQDAQAFLEAYPAGRFAPVARLKLQQLQDLALQQREEERKRREEATRREEPAQPTRHETPAAPPAQVARIEPERKPRERVLVAVPAATIKGRGLGKASVAEDWTRQVRAFRLDLQPVSNREFLDFVTAHPEWKKSQVSKSLQDGDYLNHWPGDEAVRPEDLDHPVRYVSYFAAEAYCEARGNKIPSLYQYRAAATDTGGDRLMSFSYDKPYKAPQFNFMQVEWSNAWWSGGPDPGKRIKYQHGTIHNNDPHSKYYTPAEDKRYTGRSLSFRCAE